MRDDCSWPREDARPIPPGRHEPWHRGLDRYASSGEPSGPATRRLAFRELGLATGLYGAGRMPRDELSERTQRLQTAVLRHTALCDNIDSFWSDPSHRSACTDTDHPDINEVMLATALAPEGCLVLPALD